MLRERRKSRETLWLSLSYWSLNSVSAVASVNCCSSCGKAPTKVDKILEANEVNQHRRGKKGWWAPEHYQVPRSSPDEKYKGDTAMSSVVVKPQQNVVSRVVSLPLVSSTYGMVSSAYANTKENHPYLRSVCEVAEKGVLAITAVAITTARPVLQKMEPQKHPFCRISVLVPLIPG
ncbi:hypothetical protein NDU88_006055 [Pleurodeles waltl]|uniref:Uncharacterized protein n=1 Tax=Pleurodeles waltl TaxID=8319 RepID=A0AAV7X0E2_PLEWA|nr:hypothetical protein NDU88_006055 [Pleurodeles waltl]